MVDYDSANDNKPRVDRWPHAVWIGLAVLAWVAFLGGVAYVLSVTEPLL